MTTVSVAGQNAGAVVSVLTLHIRPEGPRHYLARVFEGKVLRGTPTLHAEVDEAIEAYGRADGFPGVTAFNIWYGGWSVGPVSLLQMRTEAAKLAGRLAVLATVLR